MLSLFALIALIGLAIMAGAAARKAGMWRDGAAQPSRGALVATSAVCLGLAFLLAIYRCVVVIPPGSVGVGVVFGKVVESPYPDGLHFLPPWYSLEIMNARTRSYTMSHVHDEGAKAGDDAIAVLSANGMEMKLDVTVTYRLVPQSAPWVYRNLGDDYEDRLIRPGIGTAIREAVSRFTDEEVYGAKREQLAETMLTKLDSSLQKTIRGDYADAPAKVFSMERYRGHRDARPQPQREGHHHRQLPQRPAPDPRLGRTALSRCPYPR
jgi:regulator of protease activity HflC (stomatin/prohibitin superfamily)